MKIGIRRLIIVVISFLLQISLSLFLYLHLSDHMQAVKVVYTIISMIIILAMLRNSKNISYDLPWIIIIMVFPIIGGLLYLTIGINLRRNKTFKKIVKRQIKDTKYLVQDEKIKKEIEDNGYDQLRYITDYLNFPVSKNNEYKYYSIGNMDLLNDMLADLESAENFIFLEYFIINEGLMWNSILDVLKKKASSGVEVRVMYDDMGSITTLPYNYDKKLESFGIKCVAFNPVKPFLGIFMNNRNHRKMMNIDGRVMYTGGVNIADEYINKVKRFGEWKDNAIRISGDSIWNYTVSFLTLWNSHREEDSNYLKYKYDFKKKLKTNGYCSLYVDTPLDDEIAGENVYLNIINQAKKYLYIYTPYLIIDDVMQNALILASKRGVDIRLVLPAIPDKKVVYTVTTSYFAPLAEYGVKIYKYTPGFVHSKVFLADDEVATVGTINMDYRSLYMHFESGVYIKDGDIIPEIKKDFEDAFLKSHKLSRKEANPGLIKAVWQSILRLFASLL